MYPPVAKCQLGKAPAHPQPWKVSALTNGCMVSLFSGVKQLVSAAPKWPKKIVVFIVIVILHCYIVDLLQGFCTNLLFRLPQTRTVECCCIRETMITLPWSCTGDVSGSVTILDPTLHLPYTGTCTYKQRYPTAHPVTPHEG